jgi:hypothetical protein
MTFTDLTDVALFRFVLDSMNSPRALGKPMAKSVCPWAVANQSIQCRRDFDDPQSAERQQGNEKMSCGFHRREAFLHQDRVGFMS